MNSGSVTSRRWFQLPLRSAFLAFTFFCIVLGVFIRRVERQRHAVRQIKAAFGEVAFDFEPCWVNNYGSTARARVPDILYQTLGPDYFHDVIFVNLDSDRVSDEVLAQVEAFPNLEMLNIDGCAISNAGLRSIECLKLRSLTISNTPGIDDAGLVYVAKLSSLEQLMIDGSGVTDRGVECLNGLGNLRMLTIANSRVTEAGARFLQESLPKCDVDCY